MPPAGREVARKVTTISVPCDFANRVRAIADHRGLTIAEALERYAGAALVREWRRVVDEQHRDRAGGEG